MQGARLDRESLGGLIDDLAAVPAAERALSGIKPARADIVLGAALVLEAVYDLGGFEAMEVTSAGLREGVFFQHRLLAGAEPLLPDVRASSIRNVAFRCGADIRHADHVARLALQLHDSLAANGAIEPARGRARAAVGGEPAARRRHDDRLRRPREPLAVRDPQRRHRGLHAARDRAVAQIVRHHRKGTPGVEALEAPARPGDAGLLARCALLLRVAELLDHGHDQGVREARVVREGRALALRLAGDDRLARWRLERRLPADAVRRVLGRPLIVSP